jgi:hypothetical protein
MADKDGDFDPYHKWLGIPRDQRPVTFYQLLGISPKETDAEVIEDAAIRQSSHVRTYQLGPHGDICQRVLNEISQARRALLDPQKRRDYDAQLPKPAAPKPQTVTESSIKVPTKTKKKPARASNKGLIGSLVAGGAALLAAAIGGAIWLSQSGAPVKSSPAPKNATIASVEKKTATPLEPRRTPEPKRPELDKTPTTKKPSGVVEEFEWRNDMPGTTTLGRKSDGIAIFAGASGDFRNFSENVAVGVNRDGDWVLDARAGRAIKAEALFLPKQHAGPFDFDRSTSVTWSLGSQNPNQPACELCSESEGICWLGGMGGGWGGGEGLRVYVEDGKWRFVGVTGGADIMGEAVVCRFGKDVDRKKLRRSEVEWRPKAGPLKLLDVKDGFCALTAIRGNLQGGGQQVKLAVKDGAWWLEGKDARGDLVVRALRVSLTGKLPGLPDDTEQIVKYDPTSPRDPEASALVRKKGDGLAVEERSWRNGMPRTRRIVRGDEGIGLFTGLCGLFRGPGESISVAPDKAGDWIVEGHGVGEVNGYACSLTGLPDGFFDVRKTKIVTYAVPADKPNPPPQDLLPESEGICWITGLSGSIGNNEGIRVRVEDGRWQVDGVTGGATFAGEIAVMRFGKGVDREKLRLSEVEWRPADGPLRLMDLKDGFCVLTEVFGNQTPQHRVQLTVKDGAWWLDGQDEQKNVRVRALRVSLTGNLPTIPTGATDPNPLLAKNVDGLKVELRKWRNGSPDVTTVLRKSEGVAIFSGATGSFNGWGERVFADFDGHVDWILRGAASPQLEGYASCVTGLPAGWFDFESAKDVGWTTASDGDPLRHPVELLAENDGICWLAGISGLFGGGEGLRVYRADGKWFLHGVSGGSHVAGRAIVVPFGKRVDRTKLRISELAWRPSDGPIKLLDGRDGFCALTEIHGRFQSPTQQVKLTVKDRAWWIEGNDTQGNLRAKVMRVSLTGTLPTIAGDVAIALPRSDKIDSPNIAALEAKRPWEGQRPAPDAQALAAKQKEFHLTLKAPAAGASDEVWRKYVETMFGAALDTSDDAAMRYALLNEAFERTFPLGDPKIAERALATLERDFVVDSIGLKAAALTKASTKAASPAAFQTLGKSIDAFVKDALDADDLDRAEKIAAVGMIAGQQSKIPAEASASMKRLVQVRALAKSLLTYKAAEAILAKMPDDPKASTEAGQYLALVKGKWDEGLKLLAKGSDAKLKALAQKDLDGPSDANAREALGDAWAEFAVRDSGSFKTQAAVRAVRWYAMVLGEAGVLTRLKIEKRMSELEKFLPMQGPQPAARWTFDIDARDLIGELHGKLLGMPKFVQGRLHMKSGDSMMTVPIPFDVSERTLEIWCYLAPQNQRGQHFIRITELDKSGQNVGNLVWDGIIFSDLATDKIYPGSSFRDRSQGLELPPEKSRPTDLLHLAAVYARDNTITLYRNGTILGHSFRPDHAGKNSELNTYPKGRSAIIIGGADMNFDVEEARLYTRALSAAEIATSYRTFKK